jgi:hypothetical protein
VKHVTGNEIQRVKQQRPIALVSGRPTRPAGVRDGADADDQLGADADDQLGADADDQLGADADG